MVASFDPVRRCIAEAVGTAMLLAIVVGSGIMGERLAGADSATALLANTLATGAGLVVLISVFGPVSGAHFNPAVTFISLARGQISAREAVTYVAAQTIGGIGGVFLAHIMFALPILQVSTRLRDGSAIAVSEVIATFGLIVTILGCEKFRPQAIPAAVGLYISAAYWFTASTSFANPAATIARSLSDSFAGIAPASVPVFILSQLIGAGIGARFCVWMFKANRPG